MITLNRVSFSYENDGACTCEQTLSSLSFQIESGSFCVLQDRPAAARQRYSGSSPVCTRRQKVQFW